MFCLFLAAILDVHTWSYFAAAQTWILSRDCLHFCWRHIITSKGYYACSTILQFLEFSRKTVVLCRRKKNYSVFTHVASVCMQIYLNKRKRLHNRHKKRVELPQDWFGTPTWPPFHCFGTPIWPPWRHVKTLHTSIVWTHPDSNATLCNEFLGTTLSMICSGGHVRTAPTTTSTETWKKDIGQCDLYSYHLKYDHLNLNRQEVSPKVRVQLLTEIWTGSSPV